MADAESYDAETYDVIVVGSGCGRRHGGLAGS